MHFPISSQLSVELSFSYEKKNDSVHDKNGTERNLKETGREM